MEWNKLVKHFSTEGLNEELKETRHDIQHFGRVTKVLYFGAILLGLGLIYIINNSQNVGILVSSGIIFGAVATFTLLSDASVSAYRQKSEALLAELNIRKKQA
jgi:uncharacterized membrane protein